MHPSPPARLARRLAQAMTVLALAVLVPAMLVGLPLHCAQAASPAPAAPARVALPLSSPAWADLNAFQREALAPLQPVWNGLPAAKKRAWLTLTDRMPGMKSADREAALQRIQAWAALSPEQRRMARDNYRLAKALDRDERLATWESYRQLTPEQQTVLRDNGWTSNTGARHAGASTGLAKQAARPLAGHRPPLAGVAPPPTSAASAAPSASQVPVPASDASASPEAAD